MKKLTIFFTTLALVNLLFYSCDKEEVIVGGEIDFVEEYKSILESISNEVQVVSYNDGKVEVSSQMTLDNYSTFVQRMNNFFEDNKLKATPIKSFVNEPNNGRVAYTTECEVIYSEGSSRHYLCSVYGDDGRVTVHIVMCDPLCDHTL